jgi:hypothetical protein
MHGQSIYNQGDERPRLLGVPAPICAPWNATPHRAQDDANAQQDGGIGQ